MSSRERQPGQTNNPAKLAVWPEHWVGIGEMKCNTITMKVHLNVKLH